ncbi:cobalamin biosynthesis protein [Nocardia amamiensis]|uniref:cobalamin biosynthesis protein n=1 Tax=Nocardia amamiensis TaxID=404578 RepID=UPI000AF88094|nr:cobalamin biosynthesis protein [Nocardia amamiensis]
MPRPDLAVGVGIRPGTDETRIRAALREALGDAVVACLATIDRRATEPGLQAVAASLGVPVRTYTAIELADVPVPNPSTRTAGRLGTASVAEASALLAGHGPLLVSKTTVNGVVIAAAAAYRTR